MNTENNSKNEESHIDNKKTGTKVERINPPA